MGFPPGRLLHPGGRQRRTRRFRIGRTSKLCRQARCFS